MPLLKNILVVDDNEINRRILKKILSADYNVLEAENGAVALSILRTQGESISVVLLDIIMPVLDGYEVLRRMHEDAVLAAIPVIVASGQNSEDAEIKALSLGANDYILKPYKAQIIKHRISNTIFLRETSSFVHSVRNDALTGLYGKEYFYFKAKETLQNNPQNQYDLICFDVERFKLVNDMYGTQMGDELLKHIAAELSRTMLGHGICGRIGADEFVCLTPHRTDYSGKMFAAAVARINAFSNPVKLNLILRYGIYVIDDPTTPVNIMCDRANLAKESIKGKYDTYFACYDDEIRQRLLNEQMIVSEMKTALTQQQFKVYFQPKYDLKTEKIVGAEALVRWVHPIKGFMTPDEFIPLFEKNGFITDLDMYVWDQCCRGMKAWKEQGHAITPISVNVSRTDIYNPNLPRILLSMLETYDLSPSCFHLEITETAYTENPEQLIETTLKLKKLGFIIEMDDFGTGYSSLNMLSELPIDLLKLDIRFIQKREQQKNDRSVLSFIISLAKWMDLEVVAEGVETEDQAQMLRSLNCEYAQGYYYAKPLPQDQFEQHLLRAGSRAEQGSNTKCPPFLQSDEERRPTMLVVDAGGSDYKALQSVFGPGYHVEQLGQLAQAVDCVRSPQAAIAAVLVSLSDAVRPEALSPLLELCKPAGIPVLALYDRATDADHPALSMALSDCVERPYDTERLAWRIRNAAAFARMEKFEQEKEINAAMIEMRKRAERDVLTGLLNRAEFEVRMDHFFHGNTEPNGIFIILDIDNFKSVNDIYGHVVGDKALHSVGSQLQDIFPETEMIGRIGGDEFAMFIPYALPRERLEGKLERLCAPMQLKPETMTVTCSVGVCFSPEYGVTHKDLYRNADIALLVSKRSGKHTYEIFNKDMKLQTPSLLAQKTIRLLDNVSDAMFVSDAVTSQIVYVNETACHILKRDKESCLNKRCYELFWDRCRNCDRCDRIDRHQEDFYEETTCLKDHRTPVHIKARVEEWDGRKVKVHYLQVGTPLTGAGGQGCP